MRSQAKEALDKTAPELEALRREAAALANDAEECMRKQRYGEAEETLKSLLNSYALYIDVAARRLAALDMTDVDANEFAREREQLTADTAALLSTFRRDKDRAAADVGSDLRRCAELRQRLEARAADEEETFEKAEGDLSARLRLNEKHHKEMMDQIIERAKIVEKLSADRQQMISDHVKAREAKEKAVFEASELKKRLDEFEEMLGTVRLYLGEELTLCDALDAHCAAMGAHLASRTFGDDVEDLKFAELSALKRVYGDYVSTSGSLVTKKQHRFDALSRQMRLAKLQKDTAKESLDPEAPRHAADMERLAVTLKETEEALLALEGQQGAVESVVAGPLAALEALCAARGFGFAHPAVPAAERVVAERKAFVDKSQQYVDNEAEAVRLRREALRRAIDGAVVAESEHSALLAEEHRIGMSELRASSIAASAASPPRGGDGDSARKLLLDADSPSSVADAAANSNSPAAPAAAAPAEGAASGEPAVEPEL